MSSCNNSIPHPEVFVLAGIPGLESFHGLFSLPYFLVFITALTGNITIILIIHIEKSLHEPMFLLLAMLSFVDLSLVSATVPHMLGIFWLDAKEISIDGCAIHMFFIASLYVMESGILLAMAFDRFVAICNPLRYMIILTNNTLVKMGLAVLARTMVELTPMPILTKTLTSFRTNIIPYSYCTYMAVVQISCGDISHYIIYGFMIVITSIGMDLLFISLSYGMILRTVFHFPSWEARHKALSTCGSHLCIIALFYSPVVFSFLTQSFGYEMPINIQIIVDNLYFLVPPMINPLIYGARTKQIKERVLQVLVCHPK